MMDLAYLRLINKVLVDFFEELDFAFEDVLVDDHGVFVGEGVDAWVHFVDQDAQSPPVDPFAVSLVEENFRRQVLGSAA